MRISDWSSDVCSADLVQDLALAVWGPDDLLGPRAPGLSRALTWNPDNVLAGARHITLAGDYAYIAADSGLVVVDLSTPLEPKVTARLPLTDARASAVPFRYLCVTDAEGVKLFDITHMDRPVPVPSGPVRLPAATNLYLAPTYPRSASVRGT